MAFRIILFILLLVSLSPFMLFGIEEGEAAPKFVNPDISGRYFVSSKIIGKNWVVLDFFATYCEGCKKEIPELEEILSGFEKYGLSLYVFSVDREGTAIVRPYFEKNPTTLTILIDRFKKTADAYGIEEIPALFLIDPEGTIVVKRIGYAEENVRDIRAILAKALIEDGPG